MSYPRVQVLLLNWNGARDTIRCLASVLTLDYPSFGVVVCDNSSTDGSVDEILRWARGDDAPRPLHVARYDRATAEANAPVGQPSPDLTIIETGANLGFAGGNNVGLRYVLRRADASYIWLLNNDTIVAPGTLRRLVDQAEHDERIGAVGGTLLELNAPERVQEMGGATVSWWHGRVRPIGHGLPASAPRRVPDRLDYVSGGCTLVRRRALEEVGLLDERFFMYGEDVDWGERMRSAGYLLAYAPDAEVLHKGGGSSKRASPGNDYHNTRGSLLVIHKYHPRRLPFALAYAAGRLLLPKLLRGEWARARAVTRALRDVVHLAAWPTDMPAAAAASSTAPAVAARKPPGDGRIGVDNPLTDATR